MESDPTTASPVEISNSIDLLDADRARLTQSVAIPWSLFFAYGGVGAWFVANAASTSPGADYRAPGSFFLILAVGLVITYLLEQRSGIRFRTMGGQAIVFVTALIVTLLALYSVSLGLVSLDLSWAVVFTTLAAFLAATVLSKLVFSSALKRTARG
ncbi:hypothetical protein FYJ24_01390 [Actinomycetaceae bacterium WB03_NA08]|uniref:Uncharacterized protein n=1 Tax=Scrofimicrobium canadense TaxID=2652290 RepID=A0A6N7W5M7_9ACTO|nr:hypothetical protein [Scrofimicrobium canadense]MSS83438.1 hypothetical protein [Scrofimicrobium canadense]